MNELEEIKARAAERRQNYERSPVGFDERRILDDLDRAVAIAEWYEACYRTASDAAKGILRERDKARAAALALRDELFGDSHDWSMEYVGSPYGGQEAKAEKRLAQLKVDTEWLEETPMKGGEHHE